MERKERKTLQQYLSPVMKIVTVMQDDVVRTSNSGDDGQIKDNNSWDIDFN